MKTRMDKVIVNYARAIERGAKLKENLVVAHRERDHAHRLLKEEVQLKQAAMEVASRLVVEVSKLEGENKDLHDEVNRMKEEASEHDGALQGNFSFSLPFASHFPIFVC